MILDEHNNIIGVCTDSELLPAVEGIYPGRNYKGIEVPYDNDLAVNFQSYYYENGQLIKKYPVEYQITRKCVGRGQSTIILVPDNTIARIDDLEYEIEDGIIEYLNPNVGVHAILLKAPYCLDTIVFVEVLEL